MRSRGIENEHPVSRSGQYCWHPSWQALRLPMHSARLHDTQRAVWRTNEKNCPGHEADSPALKLRLHPLGERLDGRSLAVSGAAHEVVGLRGVELDCEHAYQRAAEQPRIA